MLFTLGFTGGASVSAGWATARPGIPIETVEAALNDELDKLGRELVTDDEMVRARALVETDELGALQRVEERADRLSMYATLFDDPGLIDRMLQRYLAVTPEAIRDAAAAVFRPENRAVVTYLPIAGTNGAADDDGTAAGAAAEAGEVAGASKPTRPRRDRHRRRRTPDAGSPALVHFPSFDRDGCRTD